MTLDSLMIAGLGLFAAGTVAAAVRSQGWQGMELARFRDDFRRTISLADKFQPALAILSLLLIGRFVLVSERGDPYAIGAGVALSLILGLSIGILVPLQKRIIQQNESAEVSGALRERWMSGHIGRTLIAVVAFALTAAAVIS